MSAELIVLRIVHVLGGVIWVGSSIFLSFFLMPALATLGPTGGSVVGALYKRKLFTVIPTIAVLVMLAGLRLMQINSGLFSGAWFSTRSGETYVIGAAGALAAFAVFMLVSHPAIMRVLQLGPQMAQASEADKARLGAEVNALRARAGMGSKASVTLLIIAAVAMAIGRYV